MGAFRAFFSLIWRFILPAALLAGAYVLAYWLRAWPITQFDNQALLGQDGLYPSAWLSCGDLAIMLAFLPVMLTNRMFGPAYAFIQIVLAWFAAAGLYVFALPALDAALKLTVPLPPQHMFTIFLGALAGAHLLSIVVFDSMRGPTWWRAPLLSGIFAAIALSGLFWGLLRAPPGAWISPLTLDLALKVAMSFLLLFLYGLLRPLTKPRDGFGGY